ncbi:hypothetical protein IW261DRAFT_1574882 [Armillaria novae-zelandiae]|uniref:Uncharacterized protein n=1 Tax=Armillaria novae-zelandiae TaxID=153914 RepID=A0AA39TP52_9AGAR|nr:hypothetical protein IW261DRAFT_1574882 [Armillaria novae-zelandiae]
MSSQRSPQKRKRTGRISTRTVTSASPAVDVSSINVVGSHATTNLSPSPERSQVPKRSRITRTRRVDSVGSADRVDCVVPPQPGTAVYARLPAVTVPVVAPIRSAMARHVSYGDLTATDVDAVAGTQYEEDSLEGGGNGTEVVYHNVDTSVADSGSEDGDRSFDKADKNAFIDDIADEVSGDSGAEDASQGESEVGDVTVCDVGDRADSLELYPMHDRSVRVAGQSESTTKPVSRQSQDGKGTSFGFLPVDIHAWLPDRRPVMSVNYSTRITLYPETLGTTVTSVALLKESTGLQDFKFSPSSSLTPDELAQYAVDVARAVVSPPAVYLEDLDGPPLPSRSSGARSRSQPKHNPSASLAQLPVHTSLGSLPIGDGVVPVPVKTLGTSKSRTSSGHTASILKSNASAASTALPALAPQSVSAALTSATGIGVSKSAVPVTTPVTVAPCRRPDLAYLAMLDAFLGDTFRESSPEDDGEGIDSPSPDVQVYVTVMLSCRPPSYSPLLCFSFVFVAAYSPAAAPADLAEPDDEALRVMLPAIQEEQLHDHYATLPALSVQWFQSGKMRLASISLLISRSTTWLDSTTETLYAARHFTGAAPYCNMATLPRSAFASDGRKPLYNNRTAVAVVTGVVIESALARTCQVGYGKSVHGLHILPFSQPWHRESTMLGLLFEETTVCSENISTAGICLASHALSSTPQHNNNRYPLPLLQGQKTTPAVKDGGSSSKSTHAKSAWPKSPSKPTTLVSKTSQDRDFYHCFGFNDEIPVFNGRASRGVQFLFRDEEFAVLPALPRFLRAELDRFTMVAVGYSPSVWSPSPSNPRVSLNIHFAIVLGRAPSAAALTSAGYGDY